MIWSYLVFSGVTSGCFICALALWRDGLRHRHFIAVISGLTLVQLMKTCGLNLSGDRDLYYAWLFPQNAATVLIAAGLASGTLLRNDRSRLAWLLYLPTLVIAAAFAFFRLRWLAVDAGQKPHNLLVARWLYTATLALSLTALAFYLLTHLGLLKGERFQQVPVRFVIQSFLLHTILAIMVTKPNLLQLVGFAHNARYENSHLTQLDTTDLLDALIKLLKEEKPYHESDFTKTKLADLLDITQHQLGELLNVHLGKSFSELINALRCADLAEAVAANPGVTVLEQGLAIGFNSKSAMNLNFRRMTGLAPTEFSALAAAEQQLVIRRLRNFLQTRG